MRNSLRSALPVRLGKPAAGHPRKPRGHGGSGSARKQDRSPQDTASDSERPPPKHGRCILPRNQQKMSARITGQHLSVQKPRRRPRNASERHLATSRFVTSAPDPFRKPRNREVTIPQMALSPTLRLPYRDPAPVSDSTPPASLAERPPAMCSAAFPHRRIPRALTPSESEPPESLRGSHNAHPRCAL